MAWPCARKQRVPTASTEERRGVAGELLREKLAAREEIARARAAQQVAIAAAQGRPINRSMANDRQAMVDVRDQTYNRLTPLRSQTELPSQTRINELEKQLRKSTDPLDRDRISQDLTFERLRAAHGAGRI